MEEKIDLYPSNDLELISEDVDPPMALPSAHNYTLTKHVHIIPFSHIPPSLEMTPSQFLVGVDDAPLGIKPVRNILDSTIAELEQDKQRTFTFSSIDMVQKWWSKLSPTKRISVTDLIQYGQLQIVGGAFVAEPQAGLR
jgi:hypothetical protein